MARGPIITDRRSSTQDTSTAIPRQRQPTQPQPKHQPSAAEKAIEAFRELNGTPAKLRSETAKRIYRVLEQYKDYFRQEDRETLANSLAEQADYAMLSDDIRLVETTMRQNVSAAIDWSKLAIPANQDEEIAGRVDEKDSIIAKIVDAAIRK